jgi:hypothetical protein
LLLVQKLIFDLKQARQVRKKLKNRGIVHALCGSRINALICVAILSLIGPRPLYTFSTKQLFLQIERSHLSSSHVCLWSSIILICTVRCGAILNVLRNISRTPLSWEQIVSCYYFKLQRLTERAERFVWLDHHETCHVHGRLFLTILTPRCKRCRCRWNILRRCD